MCVQLELVTVNAVYDWKHNMQENNCCRNVIFVLPAIASVKCFIVHSCSNEYVIVMLQCAVKYDSFDSLSLSLPSQQFSVS